MSWRSAGSSTTAAAIGSRWRIELGVAAMMEADWLESSDPESLLNQLGFTVSERKLRLFACACCRCSRQLLKNKNLRNALDVATRFVDGQATIVELAIA